MKYGEKTLGEHLRDQAGAPESKPRGVEDVSVVKDCGPPPAIVIKDGGAACGVQCFGCAQGWGGVHKFKPVGLERISKEGVEEFTNSRAVVSEVGGPGEQARRRQRSNDLAELLSQVPPEQYEGCRRLWMDHAELFERAYGASDNHHAWPGGYLDHVYQTMRLAGELYRAIDGLSHYNLSFSLADALLVLFLHDVEKPFRHEWASPGLSSVHMTKEGRKIWRENKIAAYGIKLTEEQTNALRYAEGEGDDYRSDRRVMNELAAFVHMCDVASARIWHSTRSIR